MANVNGLLRWQAQRACPVIVKNNSGLINDQEMEHSNLGCAWLQLATLSGPWLSLSETTSEYHRQGRPLRSEDLAELVQNYP